MRNLHCDMEKSRRCIKFDKNYLNTLKEDDHACVEVVKSTRHLSLHPFHLSDVNNSIKEILGEQIAKYDKTLNGILLSFQNIKLLRSLGSISFDSSFTHIDIEAEFFVFRPEVEKVLRGIVNKKSKDHVGCLVHKFFNVSLPRPANCENWLGSTTQIGHEIEFRITFTNLEARLPYIKGEIISLLSEDSGISTCEEGNNHAVNTITKFDADESAVDEEVDATTSTTRKKSRKRKFSEPTSDHNDVETETPHRKHKKHKLANSINETSSYTLTGLLNHIEEEVSEGRKVESSFEKENYDKDVRKKKKLGKSKRDTDVCKEEEPTSAVGEEIVSINRKLKRRLSTPDANSSTIKRKRTTSEIQEVNFKQESSAHPTKSKYKNATDIDEKHERRKRKKTADETLSDFNFGEIFNETFGERKPKKKKKHKADVDNTNRIELGNLQSRSTKKQTTASLLELNPADSFIRRPGGEELESAPKIDEIKEKVKRKKNADETLSDFNLSEIFNETFAERKPKNKKKHKVDVDNTNRIELENLQSRSTKKKTTASLLELNPADSFIRRPGGEKLESAPKIDEIKEQRKRKKNAYKSLSDLDLSEIFNETFAERKPKNKKKHKADVDNTNRIELGNLQSRSMKKKTTASLLELNPADSFIRRRGGEKLESEKRRRKKNADETLSDFNISEIFNETFAERKPKNKKKHKADVEIIGMAKKKTSASLLELNPTDSLVQGPRGTSEKPKKKITSNPDLLELNFDDIINESIVQKKNSSRAEARLISSKSVISRNERGRSKSQPRSVEADVFEMNRSVSESERKRSKSVARDVETNLARELFPPRETKSKKKRDSDLSLSQIDFEDLINDSAVKVKEAKPKENRKKKPKKSKDQDADVSLPELNLDQLFSEGVNSNMDSRGNTSWQNKTFELPSDSDMENILASCLPKSSSQKRKKKT